MIKLNFGQNMGGAMKS